jgi:probable addiction module antidote protein
MASTLLEGDALMLLSAESAGLAINVYSVQGGWMEGFGPTVVHRRREFSGAVKGGSRVLRDRKRTGRSFLGPEKAKKRMNVISEQISNAEREEALETLRVVLDARPDATTLPVALRYLASLRDMAWLARGAGMNRTALFRSLRAGANPKLDTIVAVLRAFGLRLSVEPAKSDASEHLDAREVDDSALG